MLGWGVCIPGRGNGLYKDLEAEEFGMPRNSNKASGTILTGDEVECVSYHSGL